MLRARHAYPVIAAFLVALLYPLSFGERRDSFPLSDYPMFARGRKSPTLTADYAVAVDPAGERTSIPPELVANAEVLQAQAAIRQAIRGGKPARRALCVELAARVSAEPGFADATEVQILRGRYDAVAYLTGVDRSGAERRWASCPIPGRDR